MEDVPDFELIIPPDYELVVEHVADLDNNSSDHKQKKKKNKNKEQKKEQKKAAAARAEETLSVVKSKEKRMEGNQRNIREKML